MKKGAIYDFAIILAAASAALLLLWGLGRLLYGDELSTDKIIHLSTVELDRRFDGFLRVGDEVYDSVTKRKVGDIINLEKSYTKQGLKYKLTINAMRSTGGHPLRTRLLWFEYTVTDSESAGVALHEPQRCLT